MLIARSENVTIQEQFAWATKFSHCNDKGKYSGKKDRDTEDTIEVHSSFL